MHKFRTNCMLTDRDPTCPFYAMEIFEHAQNFPLDGTDVTGHRRTRRGFTGYETDIKQNGYKQIQTNEMIFFCKLSVTKPLAVDVGWYKHHMNHIMKKPAFSICKNKGADLLGGYDQHLCFRYIDCTIPLLPKFQASMIEPTELMVLIKSITQATDSAKKLLANILK